MSDRIQRILSAYVAFNRRDFDAAFALLVPDVEWSATLGGNVLWGDKAVREYWDAVSASVEWRPEPDELLQRGERILAVVHQRIRGANAAAVDDRRVAHVLIFRGDQLGQPFDILDRMMKLALRIAGTPLFSTDLTAEADDIGKAYRGGFEYVSHRMNSPRLIPVRLPTPRNLAFARAKKRLDRVALDLIAARRKETTRKDDLLSLLLSSGTRERALG